MNAQLNITQLGHVDYQALRNTDLSNLWGYVDEEGNEYALVGVNGANGQNNTGGLSIVNVTDPANPVEVFFANAPNSIWREIKVWNDHAYITTEATAGLLIVDLSPLPQSNVLPTTLFHGNGWDTSHSLFIDENGRLFINGSNRGVGGCIMYDLTQDPMAPVEVGDYNVWYVHDCFARGDTLYAAHIYDGFFSMVDVSDPAQPQILGTRATPNTFTHNCWLDATGHHLYTTDETANSYVASYDVTDPTDINELDRLQTDPGSSAIVHNTYWLNDYTVQSYYTEGVSIYDVSHPDNMVEVGHFDTSPFTGGTFNGAWGVYPFLPSGNLLISDIEGGLYILGPTYVRGCYLEGTITDAQNAQPLSGASVSLVATTASGASAFDGHYATGWATAGNYDVLIHKAGYFDQTISAVALQNGITTALDVALVPFTQFAFGGTVIEEGTNAPIEGATIVIDGTDTSFIATSDANGEWTVPSMFGGSYSITAGQWGHHTVCLPAGQILEGAPAVTITLPVGYYDDFALDLGWAANSTASSGDWTRDVPIGTTYNGTACAPGSDIGGDCAGIAYVTGNAGGDAGTDDVDDGVVTLVSPSFDVAAFNDPWIRYSRWFFNGGGNGGANDAFVVSLTNGVDTVALETVTAATAGAHTWVSQQYAIAAFLAPTASMRLIARTADDAPGHLVEAGLDGFEVLPQSPFLGLAMPAASDLSVFPCPSEGDFTVQCGEGDDAVVRVFDAQGREVRAPSHLKGGRLAVHLEAAPGAYMVHVITASGERLITTMLLR